MRHLENSSVVLYFLAFVLASRPTVGQDFSPSLNPFSISAVLVGHELSRHRTERHPENDKNLYRIQEAHRCRGVEALS